MTTEAYTVTSREEAERVWADGQALADRLERRAQDEHDAAERERVGDLADALRGI